jgi:ubiquitin carboxyl-terminal hydrolase 7
VGKRLPDVQRKFTEAREFYDYLLNRIVVRFAPKNSETGEFSLPLNKKLTYSELCERVAEHIGAEASHIRFFPVNTQTGRPKNPLRHTTTYTLGQILSPSYTAYGSQSHRSDALYFEALECSVQELEQCKSVKITWLPDGQNKEVSIQMASMVCGGSC